MKLREATRSNLPSALPSRTVSEWAPEFALSGGVASTMSAIPSPLKSPTATADGVSEMLAESAASKPCDRMPGKERMFVEPAEADAAGRRTAIKRTDKHVGWLKEASPHQTCGFFAVTALYDIYGNGSERRLTHSLKNNGPRSFRWAVGRFVVRVS